MNRRAREGVPARWRRLRTTTPRDQHISTRSPHAQHVVTNPEFRIELGITSGEELDMTDEGLALLMGVPVGRLRALVEHQLGGECPDQPPERVLPIEWWLSARERVSATRTATGKDRLVDVMTYWAGKEHNADVEVDTSGGVWLVAHGG
jgi:hypothetical protein